MFRRRPAGVPETPAPEPPKPLTPAQAERLAQAEEIALAAALRRREMEKEAAHQRRLADRRHQTELKAEQKTEKGKAKEAKAHAWAVRVRLWTYRVTPLMPLVSVNLLAMFGQVGWGREHLTQVGSTPDDLARWAIAVLFAATLESIALFLAYMANRALNRGDSAGSLYAAAFGVASIVAGINYSHYASPLEDDQVSLVLVHAPGPTAMAVVFALCSMANPWLWRIKHRDDNRARLHELGLVDPGAVHLSMARKVLHPYRSFMVIWHASWGGETDPAKAVEHWERIRAERITKRKELQEAKHQARKAKALERKKAEEPPAIQSKQGAKVIPAKAERVDKPKAPTPPLKLIPGTQTAKALEPGDLPGVAVQYPDAWKYVMTNPSVSQRDLGARYLNGSRKIADRIIKAHNEWRSRNADHARTAP